MGAMDTVYWNGFENVESLLVLAKEMVELSIKISRILIVAFHLNGIKNV